MDRETELAIQATAQIVAATASELTRLALETAVRSAPPANPDWLAAQVEHEQLQDAPHWLPGRTFQILLPMVLEAIRRA